MTTLDEVLLAIGRIEGKLQVYESLSQRVSSLERWQWWLKGGWAAVAAMFVWLFRGSKEGIRRPKGSLANASK